MCMKIISTKFSQMLTVEQNGSRYIPEKWENCKIKKGIVIKWGDVAIFCRINSEIVKLQHKKIKELGIRIFIGEGY